MGCGCGGNKFSRKPVSQSARLESPRVNRTNSVQLRLQAQAIQAAQNQPPVQAQAFTTQSVTPNTASLEKDRRILEQRRRQVILSKLGRR